MTDKKHFTTLDSLRGIAAIMVVILHSYWSHDLYFYNFFRNGYLFVDLFFILSGFVIIYNYYDKILFDKISIFEFMKKRFFRLWPLHVVLLVIFFFLEVVKLIIYNKYNISGNNIPFTDNNIFSFISNLLFTQSFNLHDDATFNGPSWSIAVEFYTYLFFIISLIFFKTKSFLFKYFSFFVVLISFSFLYFKIGHLSVSHDFGFVRCLLGFFTGTLLFFIYNFAEKHKFFEISISVSIWTLLESILLVSIIWFLGYKSEVNKLDFIAYFMNFIVLFLFMFSKGLVSKVIGAKSFVFLGKISFSIYMVHYLFSLVIKNFMKIYFKADFVIDNWGGYLEIDRSIGNCVLFFYLILVIVVANFTFIHIEQRFKHGFFKN